EPKKKERDKLVNEISAWKKVMESDPKFKPGSDKFDAKEYERYSKGILGNQRAMEDLDREMKQMVGQRNEQQTIAVFKDLQDTVQRVAAAQNFQLVLAYVEPTQGDPMTFGNVMRKVQGMDMGGCVTALHIAPGLDISPQVIQMLNDNYKGAGH